MEMEFNSSFKVKVIIVANVVYILYRFDKRVRYVSRKERADVRRRVKGRFVKSGEAYDYDPLSPARSY